MGSNDVLMMGFAVMPMWLAARLWWSSRHALLEMHDSEAFVALGEAQATAPHDRLLGNGPASRWG